MYPCKTIIDEIGVCLYPQHVICGIVMEVLQDDQEVITHNNLLTDLDADCVVSAYALRVCTPMHDCRPTSYLQDHLHFLQENGSLFVYDARSMGDGDSCEPKSIGIDAIAISCVIDQMLEQGVLAAIALSALQVDAQQFVDPQDGLTDIHALPNVEEAGQEDRTAHSALLAVQVDPLSLAQCCLHFRDGFDQLTERQCRIELVIQMEEDCVRRAFLQGLAEIFLVGILAEIDQQYGLSLGVIGQLGDVAALREVAVEQPLNHWRDGQGRRDAVFELGVVAGYVGDQLGGVQALQDRIKRKHLLCHTNSRNHTHITLPLPPSPLSLPPVRSALQKWRVKSQTVSEVASILLSKYKQMSIRHLFRGLGKLLLLYTILIVLAEVGVALYLAYQLSVYSGSSLDYKAALISGMGGMWSKLWSLNLCDLWLVKASAWVFQHRVHYALLVLAALALFYKYKERSLSAPKITRRELLADYEHEEMKRAQTREAVEKLKQTPEFKKWEGQKGRMYWSPPDEDEDWEAIGKQVFDD